MRKIVERIQAMLTAAAMAEEGEVEAARQLVAEAAPAARGGRKRPPFPRGRPRAVGGALAKGSGA